MNIKDIVTCFYLYLFTVLYFSSELELTRVEVEELLSLLFDIIMSSTNSFGKNKLILIPAMVISNYVFIDNDNQIKIENLYILKQKKIKYD